MIASRKLRVGAKVIDAARSTPALLRRLQEAEGVQSNVSTGFHAVEFLLWGQNLKGPAGAPASGPRATTTRRIAATAIACAARPI